MKNPSLHAEFLLFAVLLPGLGAFLNVSSKLAALVGRSMPLLPSIP